MGGVPAPVAAVLNPKLSSVSITEWVKSCFRVPRVDSQPDGSIQICMEVLG